jgi:hypothetical protein
MVAHPKEALSALFIAPALPVRGGVDVTPAGDWPDGAGVVCANATEDTAISNAAPVKSAGFMLSLH